MEKELNCPFCELPRERIVLDHAHGVMIRDAYPISPGHSLIIPKRHIGSFFDARDEEKQSLFQLVETSKIRIDQEFAPHGYNIGINDGPAAGQTVPHCHIHLIPRYLEDVPDPRGGIRWLFPDKAKYWS